ncbi:efflux RND transporter permease subunit [Candidatus Methylomirabilis sp.]|uniref:efflux RND transporter permease subunit n=1 Tax=Candidatus Methylomirabilis sp. TaxID=2032687 RepID=UPI002A63F901|nr:efflux RND transporter permease subunit [Candidatus Methylomirabilis sp.]
MSLIEICVKRPVFATMLIISLVVMGLASFRELGLDVFPKVDMPTVTITTRLEGASPEEIESNITKRIEEAVNTINGIDELRSTTIEGQSQVFVTFVLERKIDEAANDVREKVAAVVSAFPQGTEAPAIEKFDPDAAPIMAIVVSGKRSAREITELADKKIKRQLETVKDIGAVTLVGDRKREIQLVVDPHRLEAYNLSIQQVKAAVQRQNVEIPGGNITWQTREQGLRTLGRIERAEDWGDLIVADYKGAPVRIRDIGAALDGEEEPRTLSRLDGKNAVSLLVQKQSGTNTVAVVERVKAKLQEIAQTVPPDVKFQVVRDMSRFIKRSIAEVEEHLMLGGLLASLIVAFFIGRLVRREQVVLGALLAGLTLAFFYGDPELLLTVVVGSIVVTVILFLSTARLRPAFIAAISIPASIIATFTIMRIAGFTLNNLTMLGLSLSTGIVIDDAIIVLENIFRHIEEEHRPPMEAAVTGAKEIVLAVMATTLSLVVIFLPVAFMGGLVGRFWNSFGLTATFAILVSLLVAFTLTPMLSARMLKPVVSSVEPSEEFGEGHDGHRAHDQGSKATRVYAFLERHYDRLLVWCLNHRAVVLLLAVFLLLSTVLIGRLMKPDFVVDDDMSEFEVIVETPPGSSLDRSDRILQRLEADLKTIPEVEHLFTSIGVQGKDRANITDASIYVGLTHLRQRTRSQQAIMQEVRQMFRTHPDLRISVQQIGLISGGGFKQTPFNLVLRGPDLQQLDGYAQALIKRLTAIPGFVDVDTSQAQRRPEVQVQIDRQKASDLGIRAEDVALTLRTMVGGEKVGFYREGGEQYDVRLRLKDDYRKDASVISALTVPTVTGRLVKLNNIVRLNPGRAPAQIDRYAQERQITVQANLHQMALGEATAQADAAIKAIAMSPGYSTAYLGRGKLMAEAFYNFAIAFVLSIAFIYIVLAAQFESFIHPITIMVSMFLSIPFGLVSLLAAGQTLNIYSVMGLFLLMGVVKKNAILQVDFTNVLRGRGKPRYEAQLEADRARLRPILMTTLAIIAGMLPVALGKGDGAASRASLATAVVGGQTLCLLITLLVTPVIYSYFDDLRGLRIVSWLYEFRLRTWLQDGKERV